MQELICFSVFLYHYIDSSVFLEVTRRGGYNPLNPPLILLSIVDKFSSTCQDIIIKIFKRKYTVTSPFLMYVCLTIKYKQGAWLMCNSKSFLNQARAGHKPARIWFPKIVSVRMSVCVCVFVCVCVSTPEAINN